MRLAIYPIAAASAVLFAWIASVIAKRLERTGATRGLKPAPSPAADPAP